MTKKELLKTLIRDFQLREIPALKPRKLKSKEPESIDRLQSLKRIQ